MSLQIINKKEGYCNSKKFIFHDEQIKILDKLNKILNIDETNNIIYKCDFNDNLKNKILELADDTRKYYAASTWGFFSREPCKNNALLLAKSILKYHKYDIKSRTTTHKKEGKTILTRVYEIKKII